MIGSCVVTRVITRYRTKQKNCVPARNRKLIMIVSALKKVSVKGSGAKWTVLSIKVRPPFRQANFSSQMKRITQMLYKRQNFFLQLQSKE